MLIDINGNGGGGVAGHTVVVCRWDDIVKKKTRKWSEEYQIWLSEVIFRTAEVLGKPRWESRKKSSFEVKLLKATQPHTHTHAYIIDCPAGGKGHDEGGKGREIGSDSPGEYLTSI